MANVEVGILLTVVIGALVVAVIRLTPGAPQRRTRALVGLVPGALGAFIVLTTNVDLIPDDVESRALPVVVLAISGAIAALTIRNLARR